MDEWYIRAMLPKHFFRDSPYEPDEQEYLKSIAMQQVVDAFVNELNNVDLTIALAQRIQKLAVKYKDTGLSKEELQKMSEGAEDISKSASELSLVSKLRKDKGINDVNDLLNHTIETLLL